MFKVERMLPLLMVLVPNKIIDSYEDEKVKENLERN